MSRPVPEPGQLAARVEASPVDGRPAAAGRAAPLLGPDDPLLPGPVAARLDVGRGAGRARRSCSTAAGAEVARPSRRRRALRRARPRRAGGRRAGRPGRAARRSSRRSCASCSPSGRVLVLGRAADGDDSRVDATRQALDGIVRSLAKELQRGSTANLLLVEDEASLESALRFFLSGRSAYVDGQPLRLGPAPRPRRRTGTSRWPARPRSVTGAARGIGAAIAGVLARDGAHVIAADLPAAGEALAKVANRIGGTTLHLDVAAADAPQQLLDHLRRAHRRAGHPDPQRRHHPRQADGEHEAGAVGLGASRSTSSRSCAINAALLDSDQLRDRRASSACPRRPGCPATGARPTTARPRPA